MGGAPPPNRKPVRRGRRRLAILYRLGSRGSRLALAQAHSIKALLEAKDPAAQVEIVVIKTSGDRGNREQVGAFVHELQLAILDERIDLALHCLKDLPTDPVAGLTLAAHLVREDPRDTLIGPAGGIKGLNEGATVGTGSVRRSSQLAAERQDLSFKPLVGNVDTRLRKLMEGEYGAIVLAAAGLKRLGLAETWSTGEYAQLTVTPLTEAEMLPAPGQAVLVLECREADTKSRALAACLEHRPTRLASNAERAFLKAFGGGCSVPVAALATASGESLELRGLVASPDGKRVIRGSKTGPAEAPEQLGETLAAELGEQGAFDIIRSLAGAR